MLPYCHWATYSSVTLPTRIFPATEQLSLGQVEIWGSSFHFQGTFEKKILINTTLASYLLCIYLRICWWREQQKTKSKSITNPSNWLRRKKSKQCNKLEATRWFNSQRITRRWFGNLPNRQHMPDGHFYSTNESVRDGNSSTPLCREYSEPRNSLSSRINAALIDHVKIGPVTGIEVLKSAATLVIGAQEPSQQPGMTNVPSAEQTQYWSEEKWVDAVGRPTDKPRLEYCEDQNGTCRTWTQSRCQNQSNFFSFARDTVEL